MLTPTWRQPVGLSIARAAGMKSVATVQGHPRHPMLIVFPFAYLVGGVVPGIAGSLLNKRDLLTVSRHLVHAGVISGLLAAVPGAIDYFGSVPPRSSAKKRATLHALANSSALALFTAGWWLSRRARRLSGPLTLEALGMAALSAGGWLGGTLVYRNQMGVDHRYANAGTWQEINADADRHLPLDAHLEINQMALAHTRDGQRIAVARTESGYVAFQDRCTHKGGPLSDGALICGTVQCLWHGSQFDVRSGEVKCGPAPEPIHVYATAEQPGQLVLTEG